MTLEELRQFCTVARMGNITKAANALFISQPSLSRHISSLETSLGVQLMYRDNRRISLTRAGEEFRLGAEEILGRIDQLEERVRTVGNDGEGHIVIASINFRHPWLFDFYKKYGYETAFAVTDRLISFDGQPHFDGTVRALTPADIPAMQALYEQRLSVPHLMRTEQDWRDQFRMFQDLGGMVLGWYSDTSALQGYAFVWNIPEELWAQELMSVDPEEMAQQILRHCAQLEIKITIPGEQRRLGCLRPHTKDEVWPGYFNLMFN